MAVALVGLSTDAAFDEDDDDELAPAVNAPAVPDPSAALNLPAVA